MPFKVGRQLAPSEVYYAAVGMLLSNGYECTHTVESDVLGVPEFGRVFKKDGLTHVLYFPGKDNDEPMSPSQTTPTLRGILTKVNNFLQDNRGDIPSDVNKHIIVCENNTLGLWRRNHFVYANLQPTFCSLYDAQSKKQFGLRYNLGLLKNILFPAYANGHGGTSMGVKYAGVQKGNWECGYYTVLLMMKALGVNHHVFDEAYRLPSDITQTIADISQDYYETGMRSLEANKPEDSNELSDTFDDGLGFDNQKNAVEPAKPTTLSFGQTHRKTKYALIGLGIGLGVVAVGIALALAWPVVLPAVGGLIAAHLVVGALTTTTVGWLGLAAAGVVATAVTTSLSLFAKWVKDKVSPKPAPILPATVAESKPRSRRSSTSTVTSTLSSTSMGTTTQDLAEELGASKLDTAKLTNSEENLSDPELDPADDPHPRSLKFS